MNITPDAWQADSEALRARAEKAEARIQAVRDMCDARENPDQWPPRPRMHGGALFPESLMVRDIRRALDGDA